MTARRRAQEFCDRFGLRLPILQAPMAAGRAHRNWPSLWQRPKVPRDID